MSRLRAGLGATIKLLHRDLGVTDPKYETTSQHARIRPSIRPSTDPTVVEASCTGMPLFMSYIMIAKDAHFKTKSRIFKFMT